VTPQVARSPTLEIVIDPVRNLDEDTLFVVGVRTHFVLRLNSKRKSQCDQTESYQWQ